MNFIEKIIEPKRLLLVWQPSEAVDSNRTRRLVGELVRDATGNVSFKYIQGKDLNIAIKYGLQKYGPFEDYGATYTESVMDVFRRRLPPKKRKDYGRFLKSIRIHSKESLSDFALLGYSGAYLPSDAFTLVHTFENTDGSCQLLQEIAGFRYHMKNTDGNIFMDIALGDNVNFFPEPDNPYDPQAIKIVFKGKTIGYINKFMTPTFNKWLKERNVEAVFEDVRGTLERPRIFLFVNVS